MIKINLTPEEELRSPLWWVPEIVISVVVAYVCFQVSASQLQGLQDQATDLQSQITQLDTSIASLKEKTQRYDTLEKDIDDLKNKIDSLKGITVSIINRFRPVIILEHLQTIKPPGVWFETLKINTKDSRLELVGESLHYLLVSEFMTGLKTTSQTEVDPSDLRTQVYFDDLKLVSTKMEPRSKRFEDVADIRSFSLNLIYKDRSRSSKSEGISLSATPSSTFANF